MLKNLKLRAKILFMLLLISLITAGIVGAIAFTLGTSTLKEESYKKLTAIREMKANQIENYFQQIFDQVISFSEDRMVIEATLNFKNGFDRLGKELDYSTEDLKKMDSVLYSYYQSEFLEQLFYRDSTINYFSIPREELLKNQELWLEKTADDFPTTNSESSFPSINPAEFSGNLNMSGSSTVSSLAKHIIKMFEEEGAKGDIIYQRSSTLDGLNSLVDGSDIDIVGASHKLRSAENSLFEEAGLNPLSFRIGTDALVVVVSEKNTFLYNLSSEELKEAFTTAKKWSDINPDWPDELIKRFIPSEGSGSYNLFSDVILGGDQKALLSIPNTSFIKDGENMKEKMQTDPFTVAFFSYNYYDQASLLKILEIDGLKLGNTTIRNNTYSLTRPLYLITTETKLKANKKVGVLLNYFINTVDKEVGTNLNEIDYWPQHSNHRILQYHYIANNPFPKAEKDNLIEVSENSSYNTSHQLYHPIFNNYMDRFGYYDIFIIDADSGHVIYSVSKEVDFATDILHGPYSRTNLSDVFKQVIKNDDPNCICFEDFSPYLPSYNAPASFIASPIFDGNKKIGVIVFQLPIDKINHIMTDGYNWENVGLGNTGETYLVGSDYLIRNQSRFLIEDPENYFQSLEETNISRDIIAKIKMLNSAIGLQPVITKGTQAALRGETGIQIFSDYRNIEVMSAYKPLDIEQVNWVIMSEIDKDEAYAAIPVMIKNFLFWFVILLLIVIVLSILFAQSISKPVQILTQRASDLAHGNLDDSIKIEQTDEIGILAENFEQMRCSVKKLVIDLKDINQNLESKVIERTQELDKEKTFLKTLINTIPDLIFYKDVNNKYLGANKAFEKQINYKIEDLIGKTDREFLPKEEAENFIKIDGNVLKTQTPVSGETEIENADGSKKVVYDTLKTPFFNDAGELGGLIGISRDITERKKAEDKINKQKQLLENTLESLTHPFYVIDANDYTIILANSAARKLSEENVSTCYALTHKRGTPCDSKEDPCPLKIIKETKEPVILEHTHYDTDGNERFAEVHGYPIFDDKGNVVQMIEYSEDITARKKAEKRLKSQSTALKSAANGIVITNKEGEIEWVNPAFTKLTGFTWRDVVGKNPRALKSGKHDKVFFKNLWDTILSGKVWHDEIINKKKNGELYHEEMTITPIFNDKQDIIQFVAIKQDISDRKKLEIALEKANKRMSGELNVAKDIQMSMLPLTFPAFPQRKEIDLYASLIPAREVGGDFYDFYFLDENHICFVVGDVSGKGVPAALMMAVTKTLLKSQAGNDKSTASILTHVNDEIAKDNTNYMFITVFLAILNTNTGELTYSNAGHNPSFIIDSKNHYTTKLADLHGPVVGAMEGMTYTETQLNINKDDIILAYTDGVTEAQNKDEELYSDARFENLLETGDYDSPETLTNLIIDSVHAFEDGAEQFDDITVLALQYNEDPYTIETHNISIEIKNKLVEITSAIDQFEAFGMENNIPMPIIQKFNIAFDELLNNVISYGYDDEEEHAIDVDVELKGERLIITLTDDGIPFNPFRNDPPDTMLSVEERGIGGLGVHIVKSLMDEYEYKRNADKNIITLVKFNINT